MFESSSFSCFHGVSFRFAGDAAPSIDLIFRSATFTLAMAFFGDELAESFPTVVYALFFRGFEGDFPPFKGLCARSGDEPFFGDVC